VAILALPDNRYRIAFGAVAPTPVRARRIESQIAGSELTDEVLRAAQELISEEIAPITDLRATGQYRAHMVGVMLERAMRIALSRRSGGGSPYGTVML
jgi:carbon-monoxide dehydrogenase medium subunit